jgi:aspartyl/glutamyl-tRNA(Asn/Gln) amidotransferase C subunit
MTDMPKIDIRALAALSRIAITDAEIPKLEAELAGVLAFAGAVQQVAVAAPLRHAAGLHNVTRPDTDPYEPGTFTEALLDAAPKRHGEYLEVKQVLAHTKKERA